MKPVTSQTVGAEIERLMTAPVISTHEEFILNCLMEFLPLKCREESLQLLKTEVEAQKHTNYTLVEMAAKRSKEIHG